MIGKQHLTGAHFALLMPGIKCWLNGLTFCCYAMCNVHPNNCDSMIGNAPTGVQFALLMPGMKYWLNLKYFNQILVSIDSYVAGLFCPRRVESLTKWVAFVASVDHDAALDGVAGKGAIGPDHAQTASK
eukprot:1148920-Pelagomonas_calceolata.AAC.1